MTKLDVHCHLFNKDVLTLTGKIIAGLGDIITDLIDDGDYDDADTKIERVNAFLETGLKESDQIAGILFEAYGNDSVIVPLMYDAYYLTHDVKKDLKNKLEDLLDFFDSDDAAGPELADPLKGKFGEVRDKILHDIAEAALKKDSFKIQIREMKELKEAFGDRIYPFMSYDPRRSRNLETIKKNVGPGKSFHGVKLYPPLGFSAAGPKMMDRQNGLYAWCVANDIPITAHCSCPGMPTLNDHLYVPCNSWVFVSDSKGSRNEDGKCYQYNKGKVKLTSMDEMIDFSDGGFNQKSLYFNHPDIWEKVLDTFPTLRLNLAHFGGDCSDWRTRIAGMIRSNKYPNLYTDISCRTSASELAAIKAEYVESEAIQRRLMYGSDFSILLLWSDIPDFIANIEKVFPEDQHKGLYRENARRFLKIPEGN